MKRVRHGAFYVAGAAFSPLGSRCWSSKTSNLRKACGFCVAENHLLRTSFFVAGAGFPLPQLHFFRGRGSLLKTCKPKTATRSGRQDQILLDIPKSEGSLAKYRRFGASNFQNMRKSCRIPSFSRFQSAIVQEVSHNMLVFKLGTSKIGESLAEQLRSMDSQKDR